MTAGAADVPRISSEAVGSLALWLKLHTDAALLQSAIVSAEALYQARDANSCQDVNINAQPILDLKRPSPSVLPWA
jgi:hypothetical protein